MRFPGRVQDAPSELLNCESKLPKPAVKESGIAVTPLLRKGVGEVSEAGQDFEEVLL